VNLPGTRFYATDISADALEVAQFNAKRHGVNHITFLQGSLLEPLPGPVDIIVSNLPYVRQSELKLVNTAGFEPVLALDGGEQGLDMISQLCHQAMNKLNSGGCLLLEIGVGQREVVVKQLKSLFPRALIEVFRDPGGVDRVVRMRN
jgi:release factor glutamine methyltransferase